MDEVQLEKRGIHSSKEHFTIPTSLSMNSYMEEWL